MTSKRKAYKPLYLAAQQHVVRLGVELAQVRAALAEVEDALQPLGRSLLEAVDGSRSEVIDLPPLEYVASRAFINSHARLATDFSRSGVITNYAWRGRPLRKVERP